MHISMRTQCEYVSVRGLAARERCVKGAKLVVNSVVNKVVKTQYLALGGAGACLVARSRCNSLVYSRERCPGLVARAVLQMRQGKKTCGEREEEDSYRH
jgi:hypothetical protein